MRCGGYFGYYENWEMHAEPSDLTWGQVKFMPSNMESVKVRFDEEDSVTWSWTESLN